MPRNPRADQIGTGGRIKSESPGGCARNAQSDHPTDSMDILSPGFTVRHDFLFLVIHYCFHVLDMAFDKAN